jgi:metal-sulfur cluster biosynthetic enzyme
MNAAPGSNRPTWQVELTDPELAKKIKDSLGQVFDPELGLSIIQLGLVRDVKVTPEQVILSMILTTPFCPYGPALLEMTQKKAEENLDRPVSIDLGMDVWDFSMMEEGLGFDWGIY